MKKILGMGLAAVCVLGLATGCGSSEQKTMTCTLDKNDTLNGYKLSSTYKVYYTDKAVDKVETVETVTSDDEEILNTFKETLDLTYETMSKTYGGYTFKITKTDKEVKSDVTIDYSKLNLTQLIKDEPTMKNYVNSKNKITLSGIKSMYESQGATCK